MSIRKIKVYNSKTEALRKHIEIILGPAKIFSKSFGLHPFEMIEIEQEDIKAELLAVFNDPEIDLHDTHLVVFAIKPTITSTHITDFFNDIKTTKKVTGQSLSNYRKHIEGIIQNSGDSWTSKQANIALTILSSSARQAGAELSVFNIFNPSLVNAKLDLEEQGLTAHIAVKIKIYPVKNIWSFLRDNIN